MEISQFAVLEFSCQTLFAFTFIMGVAQSNPLRASSCVGGRARTNAGTDPTTYALGKFWHANNYVGLQRYTIHETSGVRHATARASEQTLPVNINGMASTGTGTATAAS